MRERRAWLAFAAGCGVGLAACGLGALVYIEIGAFNVSAARPHSLPVYWTTKTAMARSVRLRALGIKAPARFTAAQVEAGFRDYDARCAMCHGAPATTRREPWVDGMTPPPPYLIDAARDWRPAELFWIIKHGVKMTGMPAWDLERSDAQIWDLVAFLEAWPRMDAQAYGRMRAAQTAANPTARAPPSL